MIVPMHKVFVLSRKADDQTLLDGLGALGVLHITPVDPAQAVPDEKTVTAIRETERALQVLSEISPQDQAALPDGADMPAAGGIAREVLDIQRRSAEHRSRLRALAGRLEQIAPWGDVTLAQLEKLRDAGIELRFYSVPLQQVSDIQADPQRGTRTAMPAECVEVVGTLRGKRAMVAIAERGVRSKNDAERGRRGDTETPAPIAASPHRRVSASGFRPPTSDLRPVSSRLSCDPMPWPPYDAPTLRSEAARIQQSLADDDRRLGELAHFQDDLRRELDRLRDESNCALAMRSAARRESLFAVQGWMPATRSGQLDSQLQARGVEAAIQIGEPADDDSPPTLVEPPAWAKPIEGLFGMLGTVPGYREFDVSTPFMIALPIFAAMLFADGGYGLALMLGSLLFYGKMSAVLGREFTRLLIVIGAAATLFGFLCGSFFGFLIYRPPYPVDLTAEARELGMQVSFVLGAIHLSLAQLWQAVRLFPHLKFLNKVGWALFVWGMLGVVFYFVLKSEFDRTTAWPYLLIAGAALTVLFDSPQANPLMRLVYGVANFPLSMLSAFSDVISYVRLMAVGLAGSVLAVSFNQMASDVGFLPAAVLVWVLGHGLNIGLCMIALFAHGVRLNMLEFSNNLGMQWTGRVYAPFTRKAIEENA